MKSGLIFGAIMPHGGMIPEIAGTDREIMAPLHEMCSRLGSECSDASPQTVIVITPHGHCQPDAFTVALASTARGKLSGTDGKIESQFEMDVDLAKEIVKQCQNEDLPIRSVVPVNMDETLAPLDMDWGAYIPLWYCGANFTPPPRVVVCTPCFGLGLMEHRLFGIAITKAAKVLGRDVALIASCDWAHAHMEDGPYGFHEDAKQLDQQVQAIVRRDSLGELADLSPDLIENAKIDGLWPATILYGALNETDQDSRLRGNYVGYDRPTYFGMLCAYWK